MRRLVLFSLILFSFSSCGEKAGGQRVEGNTLSDSIDLNQLACIFSALPIEVEQLNEVHDAVSSSSENGYDEEYLMMDLLEEPGRGVGMKKVRSWTRSSEKIDSLSPKSYSKPLKELLENYLEQHSTKASGMTADEYLSILSQSQTQIYWPYSERWDGHTLPVITFDPENGSETNVGYRLVEEGEERSIEEVLVTEELAKETPVWVINRNDDSGYTSIELHRQSDPDWGTGGGSIEILPTDVSDPQSPELKTLLIKDFTAMRNYDTWFAGASEFFIKCGSVEEFTASTEAELQLFNPIITDFMVVVRRDEVGMKKKLNTVLVSDMSPQLINSAFMMIEDDGGKKTKWECEAIVKVMSKSYGFVVSIPYNSRDDIVWRGSLSTKYFWNRNDVTETFGDVQLTFQIVQ